MKLLRSIGTAWPPLVLIAAITGLAIGLDDKDLLLEYLRALVWPAVVATVLWWLREPLRTKLADLLELSTGVGTARFARQEAATRDLEDDIAEASTVLVGEAPSTGDADESDPELLQVTPPPSVAPGDDSRSPNDEMNHQMRETVRRTAVERVIKESAGWGYDMAGIGFQSRPVPVIEWDDNGRPRILYASGEVAQQRASGITRLQKPVSAEDTIRRLEELIMKSERDQDNLFRKAAGGGLNRVAEEKELERLKERLRRIDPANPFAD